MGILDLVTIALLLSMLYFTFQDRDPWNFA